jgi:hypothetical protein
VASRFSDAVDRGLLDRPNVAITMDTYSHVLPGMDERAASKNGGKRETAVQEEGDRGDSNPRPSGPQPDALTN